MNTKLITCTETDQTLGYLIVRSPERNNERIVEVKDYLLIGRDTNCQMPIVDPFASHRHARIEKLNGRYLLRDLRSRNGTYVNGARIMEAVLQPDDRIRIGQTDLVFTSQQSLPTELPVLESRNRVWDSELKRLATIASSSLPVLICGPSGSGKEIISKSIHKLSPRSSGRFFSVNCSALGEALISSELFGHKRGSFTGAIEDRAGAFEMARGGTLFLDEIGDLPLDLQPKLLRALENHEIRPVGSDKTIRTDVRIIAATHKDLRKAIQEGRFRADLYYRLNVVHLSVPSLRERMEDFETFLYQFARDYRTKFSFEAIGHLKLHTWPGNIRELKNLIARGRALYGAGPIDVGDLRKLIEKPLDDVPSPALPSPNPVTFKQMEKDLILKALITHRGNQRRASAELGIPKSTLHDRIRSFGINVKELIHGFNR